MDCHRAAFSSKRPAVGNPGSSGSSLLYTIFSIVVLSSLAAAMASLTPGAVMTWLAGADQRRAYYLALSGINFWTVGTTGRYRLGDDAFTLTQAGPDADGGYVVTSTGTVAAGTGRETNFSLTARRPGSPIITFRDDLPDFTPPVVGHNTNDAGAAVVFSLKSPDPPPGFDPAAWATLWSENVGRYEGGWLRLGGGLPKTTGAIWYQGTKGSCDNGRCAFAKGLRTYFQFVFSGSDTSTKSEMYGDGFTFAVMTAGNDPREAAGGPAKGTRGEFLGYAGPGPSGRGIAPPKMAVEVDVFPNCTDGDPTENNTRRDASVANHVAAVCWGAADTLYDDNVHGAGTMPANAQGGGAGYYERPKPADGPAWLEDGQEHALRVEISRETEETHGLYTIKAWIDPVRDGRSDVSRDYGAESPQVSHTVRLTAADHGRLDTVCFGWTEATGSRGQSVAIHDFAVAFRQ